MKELNKFIVYHNFRMETFESVLKLVNTQTWFASIDIRYAYYSVPMAKYDKLKLSFQKSGKIF
jgi:hypothetical protein